MIHLGDIRDLDGTKIPVVDCITGGSPCQDLSVAGKRAGLAGERSGLFMEQIRIVGEMRERDRARGRTGYMVRPRYMVWENVPGAFSSGNPKGADFAAVIEEIIKVCEPGAAVSVRIPDRGWPKSGCYYAEDGSWSIAWRVHDAQFWGVPQRRKRIALVADFGGLSAPEVLFERKDLSGDSGEGEPARQETAGGIGTSATDASCLTGWDCQSKRIFGEQSICGTLNSGTNEGINIVPSVFCLKGNAVDRDTSMNGRWAKNESAFTLTATDRHAVCYDARGNGNRNISPTLTGDHQNRVSDYTAICVDNGQVNNISMAEQANTLDTMHDQHMVYIPSHATVRRLTPLECERLQGFPDGWTDIGEWVDSRGRTRKTTDTARYKALGNSIALPFWFWLLRRISAQYERPATLGSLFDGIGGFPLCWEMCNGKGSALWASEIEEFPIAVTKRRFGE